MLHWSQPSIVCQQWLRNYQNDHRHPTNHLIHCLGIPLIFISLTGLVNTINFGGYGLGDLALIGLGIFIIKRFLNVNGEIISFGNLMLRNS